MIKIYKLFKFLCYISSKCLFLIEDSPSDVNTNKDDDSLYLTSKENGDKKGIGKMSSEGFWVLKGSCIRSDFVRSIP